MRQVRSKTKSSCRLIPSALCRYWRLNDPFCCVHCNRDFQCFIIVRRTLKKLPLPRGGDLHPHPIHGFMGPWVSPQIASQMARIHRHRPCYVWHLSRWPSVPDFAGQSIFLTTCPAKKITVSQDAHLSHFWLGVPDLPDLPISAAVCLRIGVQKLAQILSVYMKKSRANGALPWTPLGELMTLSADLQVRPSMAFTCGTRTLQLSWTAVPKLWSP